ncbi:MAG: hypothetical protein O3A46_05775 [Candidatus Poribacteria bacterium]|nr:hypothetical protein [Candidatus Poribacteria bacterium]
MPKSVGCDVAAFHANIEARDPYTADVCILTHQDRKMMLSTFNLVANLGVDPASDRLVLNMLQQFSYR